MNIETNAFLEKYPETIDDKFKNEKIEVFDMFHNTNYRDDGFVAVVHDGICEVYSFDNGPYIKEGTFENLAQALLEVEKWA